MAKISKRSVDELIASGAPGVIRDAEVPGFGARLNANRSVSYLVEYRAGRGRGFPVRRVVLGKHGQLTPDQARSLAKNMLARGVPPQVYSYDGYWFDIGRPDDYDRVNAEFSALRESLLKEA